MSESLPPTRVLIADDDPQIRDILTELLSDQGYAVTAVADGQAAVHAAMLEPFDLCILDYEMPRMTGVEACAALRQRACTPRMPILFMTGRTDEQSISQALGAGASDYLCKPVHAPLLTMRVKNLLLLANLEEKKENLATVVKFNEESEKK
ncbi:MAG TPA: response regulator [Planctomycetota bacterium]|nr:response regulator [Planctomycetota bacterium]